MEKIKIAISSWGNIGNAISLVHKEAAKLADCDMELVGIIRRNPKDNVLDGIAVAGDVHKLPVKPDVILCTAPSHCVMEDVEKYLKLSISTVDCFDNHKEIVKYREHLDVIAKKHKAVSIIGSGWDPGFDSIQRSLLGLVVQGGETITTFGPGRSMGHTTVVKSIHNGIKEAVSLTLPGAKPGLQRREVYIEKTPALEAEAVRESITRDILAHDYFKNDDSHVFFVDSIFSHDTRRHGGIITREDANAKAQVNLVGDNSIMTATAMYNCARAAGRAKESGDFGCRTLVEIPPIDFIKGDSTAERLSRIKY
ncbi:MAG: diaminopimelate dehydrogenase [Chitinivibrionia bacterium]|nr:diaminopimelate dehydrogenase [Chitinivibrionia bacterium]